MTGVTDIGGIYRFPVAGRPARYTVKLELQGFQTIIRENVVRSRSDRRRRSSCR